MYNLDKINKIIDDINRFFKELEMAGLSENNINDVVILNASAMSIFGIMNRAIDLAEEIILKNDIQMPSAYQECFSALKKSGLVNVKLAEKMEKLIKERSLFAHHYYDLNKSKVLKLSRDIYYVKDFVEDVKKIIKSSQ